ncbi:AI-2E family transporter [Rathayibacter toxicus]|uniref:AI-2E family transporter n=1 Tax=Rathayibacter toxicus TaxID=145458 RepID=A0A2S5Y871_9MICO|nr:AI-2E family transporter [Rathayibacter toxicus]PPH58622.1 AI-2E family transporter [Rathayibacter toxicus]PPH60614.1 AI-2E family transporter [Rathayibacter toxicus]PPH88434.1 AI-2E family transporter [Rathayibacter toxicus]PPI16128.1 AI-2E family transporter [Rathayibacter toxicus]
MAPRSPPTPPLTHSLRVRHDRKVTHPITRRRTAPPDAAGRTGHDIPAGIRIAAAWSWRFLAVAGVVGLVVWLISLLPVIVIPTLIALLLTALLSPLCNGLERLRWPRGLAVLTSILVMLLVFAGLIWLVIAQSRSGFRGSDQRALASIHDIEAWLQGPPLSLSDLQLSDGAQRAITWITTHTATLASGAFVVGSRLVELLTGALLTLFSLIFLLRDGRRIWRWILRLLPSNARPAVERGGAAGWRTLSHFVRAQLGVAAINAVGIGIGALVLQLPLALPIMIVVFLGSFVPILGAIATGALAALVALLFGGPVAALIMIGVVVLVHLLEGHVLQPLILGNAVQVHPLAVVLGVAGGLEVAGLAGALFAVPTIATVYSAVSAMRSPAGDR